MGTHTQLIYQIVYSTKHREPTIIQDEKKRLFAFIYHLPTNKNCNLYRINAVEDHLHILTHIHPTIAISSLVKDIKLACDDFIKREGIFPNFKGWQDGYGAFSESIKSKERLINYIKNQEEHHKKVSFLDEYKSLLKEYEIEFDEKYLPQVQPASGLPTGKGRVVVHHTDHHFPRFHLGLFRGSILSGLL